MAGLDRLAHIYKLQSEQQTTLIGPRPIGEKEQRALAIQIASYLGEEVYDYLNQHGFKHYLPPLDRSAYARKMEVVDLLKYVLALAWVEGMTADEIFRMFEEKTRIVAEREARLERDRYIAAIDIDGVLADIADGGYDPNWSLDDQDAWMAAGNLESLEPIEPNVNALRRLRAQGWSIVLVTSRKRHRHKAIEAQTYRWLDAHEVPYDLVLWGHDKVETMTEAGIRPRIYADDSPKHAIDVALWGVKTYLIDTGDDISVATSGLTLVPNLLAIDEIIKDANECLESTESISAAAGNR